MIGRSSPVRRVVRDSSGSTLVEFALIGPTVMLLMIGALQVAIAMQSYNAIRNVAAETARFAVVEYQRGLAPSTQALEAKARALASATPYMLNSDAFAATVRDAATQRVEGAREMTITVTYTVPTVLPFKQWTSPEIDFSRPIFVLS